MNFVIKSGGGGDKITSMSNRHPYEELMSPTSSSRKPGCAKQSRTRKQKLLFFIIPTL